MSDMDEDIELLEDIKLLEDALAQQPSSDISKDHQEPPTPLKTPPTSLQTISDTLPASTPQESLINEAFKLNESLLSKYILLETQILTRLEEIHHEREEISSKLKLVSKGVKGPPRVHYKRAGYPYFKDAQRFPVPLNTDAIVKLKRGELMVVYYPSPSRWTIRDRNYLWMAARRQSATEYLENEARKLTKEQRQNQSQSEAKKEAKKSLRNSRILDHPKFDLDVDKFQPPKSYREMMGALGSREYDWMKIAAQGFNNRHSADECRVMWNVYLHPDRNRYRFTLAEDRKLIQAVKHHNNQDWEAIARTLDTGRSGYQCFIRYKTIVGPINLQNKDIPWTAREDKILSDIVDSLKIGDYIPWSYVTFYIDNRNKNQVYSRWRFSLDPSLKKGRFTSDEDELILEGVTKYGKDFSRISSELLPHRTSVQLSGRFTLLMLKTDESYNSWSVSDDMQLLKLHEELGGKWSAIGELMKKSRIYARHRYTAIGRHMAQGKELSDIPRKGGRRLGVKENEHIFDKPFILNTYEDLKEQNDVDTRLRRYFKRNQAPIGMPGRKPKYMDTAELERHTKELYHLFQKLDVYLQIPEVLNIEGLTIKDKQLLVALKQYTSGKEQKGDKYVDSLRKKMFGDDEDKKGESTYHYIPPAPFGLCFKKCGRKMNNKNCEMLIDDDCDVVLDFNLKFPENIEKMFEEEELEVFEKMTELFSRPCAEPKERRQRLEVRCKEKEPVTDSGISSISWGGKGRERRTIEDVERDKEKVIEPCYSTLLGYDCLRYMRESNNSLGWTEREQEQSRLPVSANGKTAFQKFRRRFMRLFKYPIGMVKYTEAKTASSNLVVLHRKVTEERNDSTENEKDD